MSNGIIKMKKFIVKIQLISLGLLAPALSLAALTVPQPTGAATGELNLIIERVLNTVMGVVGLLAVIVMVVGGILLATSGGDEEKSKKGKNYITYGIIGLVVIILSYAIVNYIVTKVA